MKLATTATVVVLSVTSAWAQVTENGVLLVKLAGLGVSSQGQYGITVGPVGTVNMGRMQRPFLTDLQGFYADGD